MFRKKVMLSAMCAGAMFATTVVAQDAKTILKETEIRGGFVVHLGAGDGRLTADLHATDSYLVHGLAFNAANLETARKHVKSKELYGKVTVDLLNSEILPYNDNFVDLLVADKLGNISMEEVTRVLAPLGVAYIGGKKTIKPRPDNISDWTHYLNNANNNAVADDDVVGPPNHLQWKATPNWGRSHEYIGSVRGLASSEKRFFTVYDDALTGTTEYMKDGRKTDLPQKWVLVARSAFNGALLWKKALNWNNIGGGTWAGTLLPRTIVANNKDEVFIPVGKDMSLVCFDAATGRVKKEYGIKNVFEILYEDGRLLVHRKGSSERRGLSSRPAELLFIDAVTGEPLWSKQLENLIPKSISMMADNVIYHDYSNLVMLNANDGSKKWNFEDKYKIPRRGSETIVLTEKAVLVCRFSKNNPKIRAISVEDGKLLWTAPMTKGKSCSAGGQDVFVTKDNLVWFGSCEVGHDLTTGEVKKNIGRIRATSGHHGRCYRSKATNKYILLPYRGVEFGDLSGNKKHARYDWIRSMCQVGFMPSNGMLHSTPHPCGCYPGVMVKGYNATREFINFPKSQKDIRFVKGTATPAKESSNENDWSTYRGDIKRSGDSTTAVAIPLVKKWESSLKGDLTPATYANGKVYLSNKNNNTVYCLDGETGDIVWEFVAGGTVDLPPTIYKGTALFGSHDGWAYSLNADNGKLIWKFRAAPEERKILNDNKLSSPWPIHGSITILDNVAYFAAGFSTYMDGGLYLYGLNPLTGEQKHFKNLGNPYDSTRGTKGEAFDMLGSISDVLVSDGEFLYMLQMKFDKELNVMETKEITDLGDKDMGGSHLMTKSGFLDDSNHNRIAWSYSDRWSGFYYQNQAPKAGQILSFDDKQTYAIKFFTTRNGNSPLMNLADKGYVLFADKNVTKAGLTDEDDPDCSWKGIFWLQKNNFKGKTKKGRMKSYDTTTVDIDKGTGFTRNEMPVWMKWIKLRVRGMVSTKSALFVMGTPDIVEEEDPYAAFDGKLGSVIQAVSKTDGELINEIKTESQVVFDGMMAADGKLIVVLKNGKVLCY